MMFGNKCEIELFKLEMKVIGNGKLGQNMQRYDFNILCVAFIENKRGIHHL